MFNNYHLSIHNIDNNHITNKDKCKIVQDLLPNYIDKLTSEKTNSFVKKHLEECNECHEIIENMKKDFEKEKKEREIFIKQYDKNGKIVLPVWETSGKNFDVKK